jgi:phage terminase Nu1 subunit (DNA packaging protein)
MPSRDEHVIQKMIESNEQLLNGARYTKRTYAQRKIHIQQRIDSANFDLDRLEKIYAESDADIELATRELERLRKELHDVRFGDKIARLARLKEETAELERVLRGKTPPSEGIGTSP